MRERIWSGSCHEAAQLLSAHLEDDLAGLRRGRVRRHLARCAGCRAVLRSLVRVVHQLRSLHLDGISRNPSAADAIVLEIRQPSSRRNDAPLRALTTLSDPMDDRVRH